MSWLREGVRISCRQGVPMEPFVREEIPLDPKDMGWVDGWGATQAGTIESD